MTSGSPWFGQDPVGIQGGQLVEAGEVAVEAVGLGDVGDGVLERVAREEDALFGQPQHRRVIAVDVEVDELDAPRPTSRRQALVEGQGGEDERVDPGRPGQGPASMVVLLRRERVGGTRRRDDLAVGERLGPATVVEVLVAETITKRVTPSASRRRRTKRACSTEMCVS
jgi:hypothetical protein